MKPTVSYYEMGIIQEGQRACVIPLNHPGNIKDGSYDEIINGEPVWTSTVQKYDEKTGDFETLNTLYVKID